MAELGIKDVHGVEILRLIKMVANAYDTILSEQMRTQNISAPRWHMLLRLWIEEQMGSESLSPTQLSHAQRLSKNTVSAHLRSLEEQGLIERELDQEDLRQFHIYLSDAGRNLIRQSTPGHMAFLNDLTTGLEADELKTLQQLLQKLHGSLCAHAHMNPCPAPSSESSSAAKESSQ
jgi:DNA-binding MarR family transcriptional regulator